MEKTDNWIELDKLREGMSPCINMAENLLKDSEILFKKKRYSSSVSLAILAFEEISKASVMELCMQNGKGMPQKTWKELSGGGSHKHKLSALTLQQKVFLKNKPTPESVSYIDEMSGVLGFPKPLEHEMVQIHTHIYDKILPRLNIVKQECFYLNFDKEKNQWINFDSRFNDNSKKAIAMFIIATAKKAIALQKFFSYMPYKPFDHYTVKERNMVLKSKQRKELVKVLKTKTKYSGRMNDIAIIALLNYPGEDIFDFRNFLKLPWE